MQTLALDLPAMYGDHHVIEVRRILLALPGIEAVNASSCFQAVEVTYQPTQIDAETITACLSEAGYLGSLEMPLESGEAATSSTEQAAYFRHTAAYQQTGRVVSFAQNVNDAKRALWPCPGLGAIETAEMTEAEHGEKRT